MTDRPSLSEIEKIRAEAQDDETRGFVKLARRSAESRLLSNGWIHRLPAEDGLGCWDYPKRGLRLIHSVAREEDGEVWAHCSFSRRDRVLPTWEQTRDGYWLVYDQLPGVIVVAPRATHVNLAEVMHVWTCLTRPTVPDFSRGLGSI